MAAKDVASTLGALTQAELIEEIQRRLGRSATRRIGVQHARVLQLLLADMPPGPHEVSTIYKALLDSGRSMVMSQLYRVLRVLEEAQVLESRWANFEGRPRRVFSVVGRVDAGTLHGAGHFCEHCGAPLQRS